MEPKLLLSQLAADTLAGLTANPKFLLSKYLYDDRGSQIFQDIMAMPEYYLTDCELEIFNSHKASIIEAFGHHNRMFNMIELGSGDGLKTKILLRQMVKKHINFQYISIDISAKANKELKTRLNADFPNLKVETKTGDFFFTLKNQNGFNALPKITLFLGSNIGNFSDNETHEFLMDIASFSQKGDKVLIGFDLKKSPQVIMKAYNDPHGHTRRFNLNLLERLNRELNANFNIDNFEQHTSYDPASGEVNSFLVSKIPQTVHIGELERSFQFHQWETIFMERSRKYDIPTINEMAARYGFKVMHHFTDKRRYFVDSLWVKE